MINEGVNTYGRIWDLTYDPNVQEKVYAITLTNHIMVSEDNGKTWNYLYSFPYTNGSLNQLKIAPGGKALSFAVRFCYNVNNNGIYIFDLQTKKITHHFVAPNSSLNPEINAYSIYDEAATTIFINTSFSINLSPYSESFYTHDGGVNWKSVYYSDDYATVQINNVAVNPSDSMELYLSRGLGAQNVNGGFWISEDAGETWIKTLKGIPVDQIAFNPKNTAEMFVGTGISFGANSEHLYHSLNNGFNWDTTSIAWSDYILNNITKISYDPSDTNKIWVLEENEIAYSTNGGINWHNTVYPYDGSYIYYYGTNISISPFNGNNLLITTDFFPVYSVDGGITLTQIKNPFYNVTSLAYAGYSDSEHLYYASQGGYLNKNLVNDSTTAYNIQPVDEVNGGMPGFFPDSTIAGSVFIFTPNNGFTNSSLDYSTDGGKTTYHVQGEDFANALTIIKKDPLAAHVYWVAFSTFGSGTLYKIDVSDLLNPITTPVTVPGNQDITGICFLPNNPNTVFLSQGTVVYKSINGGITWKPTTSGLEELIDGTDLIFDMDLNTLNTQQLMVATSLGVYISNDTGSTWTKSLSNYLTRKVKFSNVTNGHIIGAVYDYTNTNATLIYSINGGANWQQVAYAKTQYARIQAADFRFERDAITTFLATPDIGVISYKLNNLADVLPVTLLTFTGTVQNGNALLSWKAAHEVNVHQYILESSTDSRNFTAVGVTDALAKEDNQFYTYTDFNFANLAAKRNVVFYRLKIVDVDGKYNYSATIALQITSGAGLSVYPNPVGDVINLTINATVPGKYVISISDASGKLLYNSLHSVDAGITTLPIAANKFSGGVYFIKLCQPNGDIKKIAIIKK